MPLNLLDKKTVQDLSRTYGIVAGHDSSQNFLICDDALEAMLTAADVQKDDDILEIGSGLGVLTTALAQRAKRVVTVENEPHAVRAIHDIVAGYPNVEVKIANILAVHEQELCSWFDGDFKIVANIPYAITSKLVKKFLGPHTHARGIRKIVWLIQREVAHRITAYRPPTQVQKSENATENSANVSLLTLAVARYAHAEYFWDVPRHCFWPEPKVDSAVVKITPFPSPYSELDESIFWQFARAGFSARRKQLHHNLANILTVSKQEVQSRLSDLGIDPRSRAQELSLEDWNKVAENLKVFLKIK